MSDHNQLLADCPICGVTAKDHDEGTPMLSVKGFGRRERVHCDGCGTSGPAKDTAELAVKAWNARLAQAPHVPVSREGLFTMIGAGIMAHQPELREQDGKYELDFSPTVGPLVDDLLKFLQLPQPDKIAGQSGNAGVRREAWSTVSAFAAVMRQKLEQNRHKGGWEVGEHDDLRWQQGAYLDRLIEEAEELKKALFKADYSQNPHEIAEEAADVANFAMMIADISGGLPELPTPDTSKIDAAVEALAAGPTVEQYQESETWGEDGHEEFGKSAWDGNDEATSVDEAHATGFSQGWHSIIAAIRSAK